MAAAETAQSRAAISLLVVLVAAKAIVLSGQHAPVSAWAPFVYFWQDVLLALAAGGAGRLARHATVSWLLYGVLVAYTTLNVPVALELSSPLSPPMLRAARGPLADSVAHALTTRNVWAMTAVIGVGVAGPFVVRRLRILAGRRTIVAALAWVAVGAAATPQLDTRGLHRNAIGALVPAAVPAAAAGPAPADWRVSPFETKAADDLAPLRGKARGSNVLLVSLESTAARYLGLYGAAPDPMPNLTRLARHAMVIERAYAAYPESIKGLFATLCSRYPPYGRPAAELDGAPCRSIAQSLKDAGFRTALFHSGRFEYLDMRSVIDRRGFDELEDAGTIGGRVDSSFGIDENSTVDRILSWVDGLGPSDRFFAMYLPIEGHHPYSTTMPGPFTGRGEMSQYLNALHESDASLGRLLDGLRARGRDGDTLVVIAGDHGEAFGQHEGNSGHTLFIYDENVRVPWLFAMPGWGRDDAPIADRRIDRVASLIDTTPTVLDLLGLPASPQWQGSSLLDPQPRMALFFTDYSLGWLGLADGDWTYVYQVESGRSSLYDARSDPEQATDRSRDEPWRVAAYRERLERWAAASRVLR